MKSRHHKGAINPADFFAHIRRVAIIAMFSDDLLMEKLGLKGGNALDLVHRIGGRASMDIDLSIDGEDFADVEDLRDRIFRALASRFDSEGFVLFDERFRPKPETPPAGQNPKWGGYEVEFKLIKHEACKEFRGDLNQMRRNASRIWSQQEQVFRIEISRNEYCAPKQATYLDQFTIYVYTLPMIAIEKLRAICQQLPDYKLRKHPAPRARDFYDVRTIAAHSKLDILSQETLHLLENVFAIKDVPIALLMNIPASREFHRPDWPAVVNTTPTLNPPDFDFYFDYVVDLAGRLHAAWVK